MINNNRASNAEMRVMEKVWSCNESIAIIDLVDILNNDGENWAYQTVATFLKRLEDKGMLKHTKKGKILYYYPAMSREEYKNREAKKFVNDNFSGSLKRFLSAFSKDKGLSDEDVNDLKEWFDEFDTK